MFDNLRMILKNRGENDYKAEQGVNRDRNCSGFNGAHGKLPLVCSTSERVREYRRTCPLD